jgi:hypothetical protein
MKDVADRCEMREGKVHVLKKMKASKFILLVSSTLKQFVSRGKPYFFVMVWLLSLTTFGFGCVHRSVRYLWIGFLASLFSGILIQPLFDNHKRQ